MVATPIAPGMDTSFPFMNFLVKFGCAALAGASTGGTGGVRPWLQATDPAECDTAPQKILHVIIAVNAPSSRSSMPGTWALPHPQRAATPARAPTVSSFPTGAS